MIEITRQFVRFVGVGCMSAIGHYGLLIFLKEIAGVSPVSASSAGALLGACINYWLNYHFTFRSDKRHVEGISKFAVIAVVGIFLNTCFMVLGVDLLHIHYLISQLITTGLVLIWSFLGNRYWTFSKKASED